MNKPVKTKLCWNCEGSVSRTIENCPYCGVYLSPETSVSEDRASPSVLKPPYSPDLNLKETIPQAPYQPKEEAVDAAAKAAMQPNPFNTIFLPVFFLASGAIALFFSLILLLFSVDGILTLQWDGEIWYFYGLAALPLLFLGWRWLDRSVD